MTFFETTRRLTGAMAAALLLPMAAQADDDKSLVAILTSEEPQTQLMSMILTM